VCFRKISTRHDRRTARQREGGNGRERHDRDRSIMAVVGNGWMELDRMGFGT
jgi:hypothetical protein